MRLHAIHVGLGYVCASATALDYCACGCYTTPDNGQSAVDDVVVR